MSALLEVRNLQVTFSTDEGDVPAVRGVDLTIRKGESVALVVPHAHGSAGAGRVGHGDGQ